MILNYENRHTRRKFYALLVLLLGLCLIRYSLQINIPPMLMIGVAILAMLVGDRDEIAAMCMCCIPLHTFFTHEYVVFLGVVIYALKYGKHIRLTGIIIPILLAILWEVLHCFGGSFYIKSFVRTGVPFVVLALFMSNEETRFDYDFIVRALAITTLVMCIALFGKLLYVANWNLMDALINLQRLGEDTDEAQEKLLFAGGHQNPNTLGVLCVLGVTALMQIRRAKRGQTSDTFLAVSLLIFGIMTASRTFLVCALLMAVLLLFSQEGSIFRKIQFLLGVIVIMLLAILAIYVIVPGLLEYFIGRFDTNDITTGRIDLMILYHRYIASSLKVLFWGIGLHDFNETLGGRHQVADNVPHNGIQEIIIAWGLPGLFLFVAICIAMVIGSRRVCKKQGLIHYIPLIIILVKAQAGQLINSEYTMLAFSFAYLSMCANLSPAAEMPEEEMEEYAALPAEPVGVDFVRAVGNLLRKWWLIGLVSVSCAAVAFGVTHFAVTPMYESSALFYVNNHVSLDNSLKVFSENDIYVSQSLLDSYVVILKSRSFLDEVAEHTGLDISYSELDEMIFAAPVEETEILKVTVTSADPVEAETIANGIATLLPDRIESIIEGTSTQVADYAVVASGPSSPNKMTNALLGFIFGFVLIVMLILLDAMTNQTIRTQEDIVQLEDYPLLAAIPDLGKSNGRSKAYGYRGY